MGHGNGLGASSLQVAQARLDDDEMPSIVREALRHSRMAGFMLPGCGTTAELERAIAHQVDVVRIGTHCTEGDLAERHLGFLREHGVQAQAVLLMSHMASPDRLARERARLVEFGANAVGIIRPTTFHHVISLSSKGSPPRSMNEASEPARKGSSVRPQPRWRREPGLGGPGSAAAAGPRSTRRA